MRHKWRQLLGFPAFLLFLTVLWNEKASYWWAATTWPSASDDVSCTKVLLVADPQLIGYRHEPSNYGFLARWDSDRYLSSGYHAAKSHVNPDAIFFLGDLFDEGMEASHGEWLDTYQRFEEVFPIDDGQDVAYIFGDNDIGGEMEPVSQQAKDRFGRFFKTNLTNIAKKYMVIETYLFEEKNKRPLTPSTGTANPAAKIMLTHVPYLKAPYFYTDVGHSMDFIISAHDHTAAIYEIQRGQPQALVTSEILLNSPNYQKIIGPKEPLVELKVPTCSYRMGVANMGYGMLSICAADGSVTLYLYLFSLSLAALYILIQKLQRIKRYTWLK
ncbi:unnamed protein product [Caenorhabditis auriculariae]|uniref:Calcineurin-like phosphoesterase domain-containing protein n=1 Tax=Caenorhabditis auriculariae TaxID=2777116 RepID=A0A8S1HEQ3_9PELO|nr:unnamed protein product [Caenorhabditis auriculariae]